MKDFFTSRIRPTFAPLVVLCVAIAPLSSYAADGLKPFPIRVPGRAAATGITLADMDGSGGNEIVFVSGEGYGIAGKNGLWEGFPKVLREKSDKTKNNFDHAPTVCDLDGDSKQDIIVAGSNKRLYALRSDGRPLKGFPVKLDGTPKGPVACAPIKGDRRHVLVLTTGAGSLLRVSYIGVKAIKLASIGEGAESGVGVTDLDGDGIPEYVAVGGDSRLYIVNEDGKRRKGFAYQMRFRVSGTPSLGDIDDDGELEIVVSSQDFKVHAVNLDGSSVPGFPYETGYRLYGAPALADLDRDGVLDVVVGSGDKKLHAVNGRGEVMTGFPVSVNGRLTAEVVVGDVNYDGVPEIAGLTERGRLHVFTNRGKSFSGFPKQLDGERSLTAPALGDINGDGTPELVAQSGGGQIYAYTFERKGKAEKAVIDWGMAGHNPSGSGRFGPNPGRFKALSFGATQIPTTKELKAEYDYFNLDGRPEGKTRVRWYRDDTPATQFNDSKVIPSTATKKHEKWKYTLQDQANFDAYGENGTLARRFESPELEIANTPPTPAKVKLGPDGAKTLDVLSAKITEASSDDDGDTIVYRYSWIKDGVPEARYSNRDSVDTKATKKGEVWRVVVAPFDGETEGPSSNDVLTVLNTVPTVPEISWNIATPKVDDGLKVVIKKPSTDADGDPIAYRYRYVVSGKTLALPVDAAEIPSRTLRKGDQLEVQVTPWDDEAAGGQTALKTTYLNTPPIAPKFSISPENPTTNDPLTARVSEPQFDADQDSIELVFEWFLNGQPMELPSIVQPVETERGQKWTLRVTPRDGETAGKPFEASTTIGNTPPVGPVVALDRYDYRTTESITPKLIKSATDADEDPITLSYAWFRDGKKSRVSSAELPSTATKKGENWELRVTPNDGTINGQPVSLKITIANTPPTPPTVSFRNVEPTVKDTVTVRIEEKSTDIDKDRLAYRYRWYRNDEFLSDWALWKTTLTPEDMKKGERWRVEVTAFDGTAESTAVRAELNVRNHPPSEPKIKIVRATEQKTKLTKGKGKKSKVPPLTTSDELTCSVETASEDPDNDELSYRFRWYRDDGFVPTAGAPQVLPATTTKKGEGWRCEAQAFDGEEQSNWVKARVARIESTPPTNPTVSIYPAEPTTEDDLACQLSRPSTDADFDPIVYRFQWKLNGKLRKGMTAPLIASKNTKKGQKWECSVTASDGKLKSETASAVIAVKNTPPSSPIVELANPVYAKEDLVCTIRRSSTDPDGDAITYKYRWVKDGVTQSFAETSSSVPGRLVNEKQLWKCQVIASDGAAGSSTVDSSAVAVAPQREVEPRKETRGEKRRRRRARSRR